MRFITIILSIFFVLLMTNVRASPPNNISEIKITSLYSQMPPSREGCEEGERMMYFAIVLIIIGIILTPFGIGVPILIIGKILLIIGVIVYFFQLAFC